MMKFYFDNYETITTDTSYEGSAILYVNDERYPLYFFHGEAHLPFPVKLRQKYYVQVNHHKSQVIFRFLVITKKFEEETKYEGILGTIYSKEETIFRVWAPTAYSLSICLKDTNEIVEAKANVQGVYEAIIKGDLEKRPYTIFVEHESVEETLDPYAYSSGINSCFNYVIDRSKIHSVKKLEREYKKEESILYEVHVRDFSADVSVPFKYRGTFKALTEKGLRTENGEKAGLDYLVDLGITHIQLLPIYDFGSIREEKEAREYNWGYDPVQYQVIEGKYSSNPHDPYARMNELVDMISCYHEHGIGVNMDVVYNHVYNELPFSYDVLVPYYYFRYKDNEKSDGSFCGNEVASEHFMVRKFMKDTLYYLTKTFDFSGYRFDLMGIHDIYTMNEIDRLLSSYKPNIHLYGEGWHLPVAIPHEQCVEQANHSKVLNIGFFNDTFRNQVKLICGGHPLYHYEECVSDILKASQYTIPKQSIQYVSCHDDYTLYDNFYYEFQKDNVISSMKLAYIFVFLSMGVPFLHAGCEAARSKLGIKNSYASSLEINTIHWNKTKEQQELTEFVKQLIQFRKDHTLFQINTKEEIEEHVKVQVKNGIIVYQIKDLIIYINPSEETKTVENKGILYLCNENYDPNGIQGDNYVKVAPYMCVAMQI